MKKTHLISMLVATLVFVPLCLMSQNLELPMINPNKVTLNATTKHFEFKGHQLSGSVQSFIELLKNDGFSVETEENGNYLLQGKFAGENATILVMSSEQTHTVYLVSVSISGYQTWRTIKRAYTEFEEMLISKYGRPLSNKTAKRFLIPYYEGDGYEFTAIDNDKCLYSSIFEQKEGSVTLSISKGLNRMEPMILLVYEDEINTIIAESERKSSAIKDL